MELILFVPNICQPLGRMSSKLKIQPKGQMASTFDLSSPVNIFQSKQFKKTKDILIQKLGGEGAIPCKQLYQKAEDQGISKKVLWSAEKRLNVKLDKGGFKDGWLWQLPLKYPLKIPEDSRYRMVIFGNLRSVSINRRGKFNHF